MISDLMRMEEDAADEEGYRTMYRGSDVITL